MNRSELEIFGQVVFIYGKSYLKIFYAENNYGPMARQDLDGHLPARFTLGVF